MIWLFIVHTVRLAMEMFEKWSEMILTVLLIFTIDNRTLVYLALQSKLHIHDLPSFSDKDFPITCISLGRHQ